RHILAVAVVSLVTFHNVKTGQMILEKSMSQALRSFSNSSTHSISQTGPSHCPKPCSAWWRWMLGWRAYQYD
ncbi:hypothetical protein DFH29DRAFT_921294, partial [Suillus ampliporus]